MNDKNIAAVILAAGLGKRMKSDIPKVLHPVAGKPMLAYPIEAVHALGVKKIVVVVGHKAGMVVDVIGKNVHPPVCRFINFIKQEPQLGTGHAVFQAHKALKGWKGDVLILSGDVPLITRETLLGLLEMHKRKQAVLTFISALVDDPSGYGRVLRDTNNTILKIIEDKDATPEEKEINEINAGIYCIKSDFLFSGLKNIKRENAQGEYYLPDLVEAALQQGQRVACLTHIDPPEVRGVNTRVELAQAGERMQDRVNHELMLSGVTLVDHRTIYIHSGITIGIDTIIYPNVIIEGETKIGSRCFIEEGCKIKDSIIGDGSVIKSNSVIESSHIGKDASIGPFARLRPESHIEDNAKIGNFVEVKKSTIGKGTKINHLSYIGDAVIGKNVNVGAGCITCNYDGVKKHQTIIEDGAFIGSDSQLVAPIKIGKNAYIGSGSTITKNVPAGSLALTRPEQRIVKGWVGKKRLKK